MALLMALLMAALTRRRVFRVCRARYARLDGSGARRAGGRWNSPGSGRDMDGLESIPDPHECCRSKNGEFATLDWTLLIL